MEVISVSNFKFVEVENVVEPEQHLKATAELLNSLGVRWYFAFGTALGLYRDNGFVPRDTDVDVAVIGDEKADEIIEHLKVQHTYIRSVVKDGKQMQAAFQAKDGFIIDICFFYQEADSLISFCEGGMWKDRPEVIGEPQLCATRYGQFPLPEKIEEYLTDRYGDWQTPRYGAITSSIKICE